MSSARSPTPVNGWVPVSPLVIKRPLARRCLTALVRRLGRIQVDQDPSAVGLVRRKSLEDARQFRSTIAADLIFCINVFCDLVSQGWQVKVRKGLLYAKSPATIELDPVKEKARVRRAHLIERDVQLSQPSVRTFLTEMERLRIWRDDWHSIFSLMRDGNELAAQLRAAACRTGGERIDLLERAIDPYLQPVLAGTKCEFTGLDLMDVWRYFRHTWTTVYQNTPGRKLFFLIRDRAAMNHPVMGIGALGSPIIQLSVRDSWIGWTGEQIADAIVNKPTKRWAVWVLGSLENLLSSIDRSDLLRAKGLTEQDVLRPTQTAISKLRALAASERQLHRLYPGTLQHKKVGKESTESDWRRESRTHLFRSKRAAALADLLAARHALQEGGLGLPDRELLREVASKSAGRKAIAAIVRYTKAVHAGIDMMDITVCGAVAPYNRILGGKLVSLLMASPEIAGEYARRYRATPSLIASAMAGRQICRSPRLVLLGTTSLYGAGASQYHRLRYKPRGDRTGGELAYIPLGQTAGFGSFQFSQETVSAVEPVLSRLDRGRRVNSIFGEGVNPKLRKLRGALDAVGLPSDLLMQHTSPRIVYAVPLAHNFREVLLGLEQKPKYILAQTKESSQKIVAFWRERWLARRIELPDVIADLDRHRLTYPITHGARVCRAEANLEQQMTLSLRSPQQVIQVADVDIATFRKLDEPADVATSDACERPRIGRAVGAPLLASR